VSKWTGDDQVTIAILPDHPTFCRTKTHSSDPVPFLIYRPGSKPDKVQKYDEESVKEGAYGELYGNEFMNALTHTSSFTVGYRKMKSALKKKWGS
jgi:2,3-bisphosphoglycerate-independent phosphoglycerate mutase